MVDHSVIEDLIELYAIDWDLDGMAYDDPYRSNWIGSGCGRHAFKFDDKVVKINHAGTFGRDTNLIEYHNYLHWLVNGVPGNILLPRMELIKVSGVSVILADYIEGEPVDMWLERHMTTNAVREYLERFNDNHGLTDAWGNNVLVDDNGFWWLVDLDAEEKLLSEY